MQIKYIQIYTNVEFVLYTLVLPMVRSGVGLILDPERELTFCPLEGAESKAFCAEAEVGFKSSSRAEGSDACAYDDDGKKYSSLFFLSRVHGMHSISELYEFALIFRRRRRVRLERKEAKDKKRGVKEAGVVEKENGSSTYDRRSRIFCYSVYID